MIKAILFDLDGTLLNREASVQAFIRDQYERKIKVLGSVEKDQYCMRFIELDNNGYTWKDQVYHQIVHEYRLDISSEELLDDYIDFFQNHCVAFEGMVELINGLKQSGYLLGLVSNGRTHFQLKNVRALGIEERFDTILISEEEGVKKPDSQIFLRALNRLNVSSYEAVYVGDHPVNDIKGAKNVGLRTIWKKNGQVSELEEDASTNSLIDILQIVREWTLKDRAALLGKEYFTL